MLQKERKANNFVNNQLTLKCTTCNCGTDRSRDGSNCKFSNEESASILTRWSRTLKEGAAVGLRVKSRTPSNGGQ